jgi:hypothetical protein
MRAYVHRGEYMRGFVSAYVCTVFLKKSLPNTINLIGYLYGKWWALTNEVSVHVYVKIANLGSIILYFCKMLDAIAHDIHKCMYF